MLLINDLWKRIEATTDRLNDCYTLFGVEEGQLDQEAMLKKKEIQKKDLASLVLLILKTEKKNLELLRAAALEIESTQKESVEQNNTVIRLQNELIESNRIKLQLLLTPKILKVRC